MFFLKKVSTLILLLAAFCFISCNDIAKESSSNVIQPQIVNYLDTIPKRYADYKTNTVIKDELNEYFKRDFKKAFGKGIINDLPFKLETAEKCDDKYILSLRHSLTSKYYNEGVLSNLEIDLYAVTDEKTAKGLREGEFYLVEAIFEDYLTFQNNEDYCALVLMSPFIGFGSGMSDDEIQLGAIGVKLKSIKPFLSQK